MAGTPLAEAFVRVRALTDKFKDDIRDGLRGVGDDFGKQFAREVSAQLRGERDAFEAEGRALGEQAGDAAGNAFGEHMAEHGAVAFGDDASPFVAAGKKLGADAGDAAGEAFGDRMEEGAVRFGDDRAPFARAGTEIGDASGKAAGERFADRMEEGAVRFGDDGNPFVEVGKKTGKESGEAAGDSFKENLNRRASEGARDHGRKVGRDFGDGANDGLRDSLKGIAGAFGDVSAAIGKVLGTGSLWGGIAAGVAGLGAAAASSAGYVVELAAALAPLGGLLAALPGVALTGAAAFSVWKLATAGLSDAFAAALAYNDEALGAATSKMSETGRIFVQEFLLIRGSLADFKEAAQGSFLEPLLGQLARWIDAARALKPAISGLAGEFGGLVRTVLDFATARGTLLDFTSVMRDTQSLVGALRGALVPLLTGFVELGSTGSGWLASFAPALRDVLTTFGEWMSEIARSGVALGWLQDATVVLQQLGRLVRDVWQTFTGLLDAAAAAGGNALGVLGSLVGAMNEWVNSAKGQETLVEIFRALQAIGRALLPVITSLAGAVAEIAPEAAKVATALGPVLADAISVLGKGIAALGPGLVKMVESFGRMVTAIGPLEPLGRAIGDIFAALGEALALIVPELAQIALALAPALANAIRALAPALAALGPGLVAIAEYLGDAFANPAFVDGLLAIGKGLADVLVAAAPLLPLIAQLAGILGQVLGGALTNLGVALRPIIEALGAALEPALRAITDALNLLIPLMPPIYQAFGEIGAALITTLLPPLLDLIPALVNALIPAFAEFARQLQPLIPLLAALAIQLIQQVLPAILPILPQLTELSLALARLGLTLAQLVADAAPYIERIIQIFQYLYDTLVGHSIIPDLINAIRDWWQKGVDWVRGIVSWFGDLPGMMSGWLGGVLTVVAQHWDGIRNAISERVGQARDAISRTLDDISNRWSQGWANVRNIVGNAWNSIHNAVYDGIRNVLAIVSSLPTSIVNSMGNLGGLLYGSGQSLMSGFINGLYSMLDQAYNAAADILNRIRQLFPFSPAREGPFSGRGWTLYSGQSLIAGLAEGVLQQEGELTSAMDQVMRAGAAALAPALPTLAGPSLAPEFSGAIGAPTTGAGVATAAPRVINVENITLQGVLDPTNPVSYRRMVERLREAIRELEREVYA